MTEPHVFVTIGLWLVGSICLVAFLVDLLDAPQEIIYASLGIGIAAAIAESLGRGEKK